MLISLEKAINLINQGQIIAVPTETVYGLAAAIKNPSAINKIFSLKGRPLNNPLIIHISHFSELEEFIFEIPNDVDLLTKTFWPGPLTIILPVKEDKIPSNVRAGLATAAFRIPQHPLALQLITHTGPLAMPSANISGRPSATRREHIELDFGKNFPVLDGGPCEKGLESTILNWNGQCWEIVRLGAILGSQLAEALGYLPNESFKKDKNPICPGQMYRHYAPKARLRPLIEGNGIIIGFSEREYVNAKQVISLGYLKNPQEVAQNLYRILRQLDEKNISEAQVDMDFPKEGLLRTIHERLTRACEKLDIFESVGNDNG